MIGLADAGRPIGQGAWLGLRQRDEFFEIGRGNRRIGDQEVGQFHHLCNVAEAARRVVLQLGIHAGVDGMAGGHSPQGVAVARRARHRLRADGAAAARQVFDHRGLAQAFDPVCRGARDGVQDAAGGRGHDHLDRFGGIGRIGVCRRAAQSHKGGHRRTGHPR